MQTGRKEDEEPDFNISRMMETSEIFDNDEWEVFTSNSEKKAGTQPIFNQGVLPYSFIFKKTPDPHMTDE